MKDRNARTAASSARVGIGQSTALGFGATKSSSFGSASSAISYLAEQPDLSLIPDPNVTVHFKNLSKKDSTTKSKALDELQAYLSSLSENKQELEDAFIDAWIKVFPRLSIDASRRVRQSAFVLQKAVSRASGKRLAKHMPLIAPAWLAGCYDGEKGVMRAAHDGLQSLFGTSQKQKNLRKAYQAQIVSFGTDILQNETKDSLSDPKGTTPEDAEAVFNRVVSSSLSAIVDVISTLDELELEVDGALYDNLLGSSRLWAMLSEGDVSARRAVLNLTKTCFGKLPTYASQHLDLIAKVLTAKRTFRHQLGTSHLYVEILTLIIYQKPEVAQDGKALELLQNIGKHGSQGGNAQFWVNLAQLIKALPDDAIPREYDDTAKILDNIRQGLGKRDEPATNQPTAYRCYFIALERLCENLTPIDKEKVASAWAIPLVSHYIKPKPDRQQWPLSNSHALQACVDALKNDTVQSVAECEWDGIASGLLDSLKTSLPAQAQDFEQSQVGVEREGSRLFSLQGKASGSQISERLQSAFDKATRDVVSASIDLLRSREGKPFGAAGCIAAALEHQSLTPEPSTLETLDAFLLTDLPNLLFSPSDSRLINVLYLSSARPSFDASWATSLEIITSHTDSNEKHNLLWEFITSPKAATSADRIQRNSLVQQYLLEFLMSTVTSNGNMSQWDRILKRSPPLLSQEILDSLTSNLSEVLSVEDESCSSRLEGLRQIGRYKADSLRSFASSDRGADLAQRLLKVQERGDESDVMTAIELLSSLDNPVAGDGVDASHSHVAQVLDKSLYDATPDSLSVETLVELATRSFRSSPTVDTLKRLLPNVKSWASSLQPFLSVPLPPSLAISEGLSGMLDIVTSAQKGDGQYQPPPVDADGLSPLLRMSLYTLRLLTQAGDIKLRSVGGDTANEIHRLMLLTADIANDRLTYDRANPLYIGSAPDEEVTEFVANTKAYLQPMARPAPTASGGPVNDDPLDTLFHKASDLSPEALYHLRSWQKAKEKVIELAGWNSAANKQVESEILELKKRDDNFLRLGAYIAVFGTHLDGSAVLLRFVNELVAGLTSMDVMIKLEEAHKSVVLLSLTLHSCEHILTSIAKQRIIFFIKHVVPWLSQSIPDGLKAQICKCLTVVLPHIKDVYGEDWEHVLDFLSVCWTDARPLTESSAGSSTIVLWHSSLKLFATLRRLIQDEETNEDLKDAWKEKLDDLAQGLANLLKQCGRLSDEANQPLRTTNELLARQIKAVPARKLGDLSGLYALLDTQSREVQQTAFDILHRQIPQDQEEISVNVALEKSAARLPDELLSLVFQPPPSELYEDLSSSRTMPSPLFAYLSSWLLVFDHFKNSSHKVQSDYVAHIKEQGVHTSLLDVVFASLGHAQSRSVDASKFDPSFYSFNVQASPKRDVQWLLIHLYYLCLSRLPSLTKAWWIDCRSRQIRSQVEPWTEKHFSPLVIADALRAVAEWSAQQDQNADDALIIKANEKAKEVTAGREIDDQQLTIAIRLPSNFPLGPVSVEGVNRVAVEEKKWKSWLLNTQGVITFSDNSIADGLIAFRRNVSGQLKGQTECAICYSIVSQDKQLPTKKCKTCKNMFHGSCLYRWFKSSNSSSCPLCRTAFNYA